MVAGIPVESVHSDSLGELAPPGLGVHPGRRKGCNMDKVGPLPDVYTKALVKLRLLVKFQEPLFR